QQILEPFQRQLRTKRGRRRKRLILSCPFVLLAPSEILLGNLLAARYFEQLAARYFNPRSSAKKTPPKRVLYGLFSRLQSACPRAKILPLWLAREVVLLSVIYISVVKGGKRLISRFPYYEIRNIKYGILECPKLVQSAGFWCLSYCD